MTLRVLSPEICGDQAALSIETPQGRARLSFRGNGLAPCGEALLAATLLPAMRCADRLELPLPVPARLLHQAQMLQEIWHSWWPQFRIVEIIAPVANAPLTATSRVGMFFTGGTDSCFTLLRHLEEIDTLIYVTGLEPGVRAPAIRELVVGRLREFAARENKEFLEVQTDLRDFSDRYSHWGTHYHGSALAAVAHMLPQLGKIYIASSYSYRELLPWGSHTLTDPLWSTDDREFLHDGAASSRIDKLRAIAASERARSILRVCPDNEGGAYNCGKCGKCLRTMAALACLGVLDDFPTLPGNVDFRAVSRMKLSQGGQYLFRDALTEARTHRVDPRVARAMRDALNERYTRPLHCLVNGTGRQALAVYRGLKQLIR